MLSPRRSALLSPRKKAGDTTEDRLKRAEERMMRSTRELSAFSRASSEMMSGAQARASERHDGSWENRGPSRQTNDKSRSSERKSTGWQLITPSRSSKANVVSGTLTKRGRGLPWSWKTRYCVFYGASRTLCWYANEKEAQKFEAPRGQMEVVGACSLPFGVMCSGKTGLTFAGPGGARLQVRAPNADEQERWKLAVSESFEQKLVPPTHSGKRGAPALTSLGSSSSRLANLGIALDVEYGQ